MWELGVPMNGTMKRLILTGEKGFDIREEEIAVTAGRVRVTMPKTSAMILQHVDSEERYWEKQKTHRSFFY